jgi:hypothetical protein
MSGKAAVSTNRTAISPVLFLDARCLNDFFGAIVRVTKAYRRRLCSLACLLITNRMRAQGSGSMLLRGTHAVSIPDDRYAAPDALVSAYQQKTLPAWSRKGFGRRTATTTITKAALIT